MGCLDKRSLPRVRQGPLSIESFPAPFYDRDITPMSEYETDKFSRTESGKYREDGVTPWSPKNAIRVTLLDEDDDSVEFFGTHRSTGSASITAIDESISSVNDVEDV